MFRKLTLIPALVALGFALPVAAQSADPASAAPQGKPISREDAAMQTRMSVHVNGTVLADLKPMVADEQKLGALFLRMVLLSKQEAVGASCAAYSLDKQRMVAAMLGTIVPVTEGLEKDQAQATINQVLRHYHTMLGGQLAQYAYNPDSFCGAGKDLYDSLVANGDGDKILVLTPAA